ncbi:MAG: serine/threonine protein kinase [Gemmatimonadetes bacterium]|nr:serine/threonine protein kinase [Gemmatimonadota bacterium]
MSPVSWARLQSLFDVALSLEPAEREDYLSRECGPDTALRLQIESLIAASAEAGDRIDGIAGLASRELAPIAAPGQRVGPWELVREIGRGGMGAVFLAHRVDGEYEARAAIKLIGGMRTPEHLRRFRAERQILAGLDHPNIARLLDGGSTDEGVPWVAMELVEGMPLDRYCDQAGLTVEHRIALFLDVCAAVAFAHRHLVVHRDIKPGNILVTAEGVPKLLDFGIAKLLDPEAADSAETRTAMRLLTPAYGSPEQLRGEPVTIAADVYALGIVLYRLLAGRMPYDLEEKSLTEIERLVCELDPPRASTIALTPRLERKLRGDLDTILMTALRKEPAARYASVDRFADDLKRHVTGLPVLARGEHWAYRARKFTRRHRAGVAVATGLVILLTGFTGALGIQNQRLAAERDAATLARANAEQVTSFLTDVFTGSDPARSRGDSVTARELLDAGALRVETELADQPALRAAMMRVMGNVYMRLGMYDEARPLLEQAVAGHLALYGADHVETADSRAILATWLVNDGDLEAAGQMFRQVLETRRRLYGGEHRDVAGSLTDLGWIAERSENFVEAESLYREALAVHRNVSDAVDPKAVRLVVRLGGVLRHTGRLDEAEPLLREAVASLEAHHGEVHPEVASALRNLAALLRDKGDYEGADTLYGEALAQRRLLLGNDHSDVAITLGSYGLMLQQMGEYERALAAFTEALDILERARQGPHPNFTFAYYDLAVELSRTGRHDEAIARMQQAVRTGDEVYPSEHPRRAVLRLGLALAYTADDRHGEAEPWLRQAVALRREHRPPGHIEIGEALSELGANLIALGNYAEAESSLIEARDILLSAGSGSDRAAGVANDRLAELKRLWVLSDS